MSRFRLDKWYLDVVSPAGDVVIVYAARLAWGGLAVDWQSVLSRGARDDRATTRSRLARFDDPRVDDGCVTWVSEALGLRGAWIHGGRSIAHEVLGGDDGAIAWSCVAPFAAARVEDEGRVIEGDGYVESLAMTAPPWRLPFRELRWGRFASAEGSVVWIDRRGGGADACDVWVDGERAPDARVDDDGVRAPAATLTWGEGRSLREGAIGATALAALPEAVRAHFPGRALLLDERKWLSRGTLSRPGRRAVEGWVVYEVVRWP